jgi:hypothetical protein
MGRVASAGDNAAMESFWALLQKNVLDRRRWRTREELHYAIVFWIEHTYNRRRRQRGLGRLTPVEYELAFATDKATTCGLNCHNHCQLDRQRPLALYGPTRPTRGRGSWGRRCSGWRSRSRRATCPWGNRRLYLPRRPAR